VQFLNHTAHAPAIHGHPYPWTCDINEKIGLTHHDFMLHQQKHLWHFRQKFFQSLAKTDFILPMLEQINFPQFQTFHTTLSSETQIQWQVQGGSTP
jgi:hypothetical protein